MDFQTIHDGIDRVQTIAYNTMKDVFGNQSFQDTWTSLCEFVESNYECLFSIAAGFSFLSHPLLFSTGMTLGYWASDKTISVVPGDFQFNCGSLFANATAKMSALVIALILRFVLHATISAMAVGFLAGAAVKRLLLHAIGADVRVPEAHAH